MKLSSLIIFCLLFLAGCLSADKANELAGDKAANANGGGGEANSLGFLVTAVTPSAGSFSGNYDVTISGSQFTTSTTFKIGGTDCLSTTVISASSAVCRVPAGSMGLQDVTAVKGSQSNTLASGFQYVGNATVSSHTPTVVPATIPTLITITGTNFVPGATVNVSHPSLPLLPCQPVTVVNSTTMTCYTPTLSAVQSHTVKSSGILSSILITNPDTTQVSLANSLDLTPAPQYTSLSFGASGVTAPPTDGVLNSGLAAYTLTINGNYFDAGVVVRVAGVNAGACSYVSATQITCTALPAVGGGTVEGNYNVVLTNGDSQSVTQSILFARKPTVTSTTPANVRYTGGDIATINGTGLGLTPTIDIYNNANSASLGSCSLATSVPVSCTTPALGSAQATTIRLRNDYGYRTTYNPLNFVTATVLALNNTEVGRVVQGSSYTHTITLSNPSVTVAATGITIDTSALAAPFSYVSTTCGATLAAASSCNIVVNYSPTNLNFHESGYIDINYNDGIGAQILSKKLSAWSAPLDIMVPTLNYGTVPYGVNHQGAGNEARFTKPLVLVNRGKATVTLNSGAFTTGTQWLRTPASERFNQAAPLNYECGATLAAGAKCVWSLDFQPTSSGVKNDIYTITYNGTYTKSANLTGTGGTATLTTCNPANTTWNAQGAGTSGSPYLICTEAQFNDLITATQAATGNSRLSNYLQTADITFTAPLANPILLNGSGTYMGGGYRLINAILSQPGVSNIGIISHGGGIVVTVSNIQLYNSQITGAGNTGSVGGYATVGSNSFAYGIVVANDTSGGTFGYPTAGSITQSYFLGEITCSGSTCGGIVGANAGTADCFTHGKVSGASQTGGIAGMLTTGQVATNTYSSAAISGTATVGGIVSIFAATGGVEDSHFYGSISMTSSGGGIVGLLSGTSSIKRSSFRGSINGASIIGGLIGSELFGATYVALIDQSVSSGSITATSSVGGIYGTQGHPLQSMTIQDSFSLTQMTTSNSSGGLSAYNSNLDIITRSYVARPNGSNLFTTSSATNYMVTVGTSGTYNDIFYLSGIASNQTPSGEFVDLTDAQMRAALPNAFNSIGAFDFSVTPVWKYSALLPTQGYPYPMLQWMPDDWMP